MNRYKMQENAIKSNISSDTFNDAVIYAARTGEQRMIIEEYSDDASNAENDERDDLIPRMYKFPQGNLYNCFFLYRLCA